MGHTHYVIITKGKYVSRLLTDKMVCKQTYFIFLEAWIKSNVSTVLLLLHQILLAFRFLRPDIMLNCTWFLQIIVMLR